MYSRLVISEDRMSPVDARRVILIDGQNDFSGTTSEGLPFGVYGFLLPLLSMIALLGLGLMDLRSRKNRISREK